MHLLDVNSSSIKQFDNFAENKLKKLNTGFLKVRWAKTV